MDDRNKKNGGVWLLVKEIMRKDGDKITGKEF